MAPARLNRFVFSVSGADALGFLQDMLTQDIGQLEGSRVVYAGLLTAQGKVIADMHVWADAEGVALIEADAGRGPVLMQRLTMFKLRRDVQIAEAVDRSVAFGEEAFEGGAPDPRFPNGDLGWRAIVGRKEASSMEDGAARFEALRLACGAPDLARDAGPEEVFALEALFEELHGVDFKKGCFPGQENVSRMKRRATTRKKFCLLQHEGPAIEPGVAVLAGEHEIGSVRSACDGRALALLRLDRALEALRSGTELHAEGRGVQLDPPPWLILPTSNERDS